MYAYDWVLSLSDEVELVSKSGLTWPIAIYFLSRLTLFAHMCLVSLYQRDLSPPVYKSTMS
ncbi:hypothetical protein FIBSPDRAFT_968752 [Athelia psychrophila]|uniref:DUF6533 domain-containing protein n=1 Tax=Athelia psychrophila TaxID=1759441 RepID=A0A167U9C9_9AGAM|nr:hypothetical protein FIBSPDRAFT_968752 [Fibularhizoctonia sp. CBS 109695]